MKTFTVDGQQWQFDPVIRWLYHPGGLVTSQFRHCWNGQWVCDKWSGNLTEKTKLAILIVMNAV